MLGIFTIVAASYFIWILLLIYGWLNVFSHSSQHQATGQKTSFAVLVAFRNEAKNLPSLLLSLFNQTDSDFEIILINDHSEDEFETVISQFNLPNLRVLHLDKKEGKKAAIQEGIRHTQADWILFTDADCKLPPNWVASYRQQILNSPNLKMIYGAVIFDSTNGFWQKLFSLDFSSLVASGISFKGLKHPIYCNAANMAVSKEVYEQPQFSFNEKYASGDDVFLLQFIRKHWGVSQIQVNQNAVVTTVSPQNLKEFIWQRIRWGGKSKSYQGLWSKFVPLYVLGVNMYSLFLLLMGVFAGQWKYFVIFMALRLILDNLYVSLFYRKYNPQSSDLIYALPFLLLYPFYIVSAAAMSLGSYQWKGRVLK